MSSLELTPVAENDPAINVTKVDLRRPDGTMPAYAAQPRTARADTPGVVVVMHVWGIDEPIRDVVRRFAKAGFAAIAPDLYWRSRAPGGDGETDYEKFKPHREKLQDAQVDSDLRAAALWLKAAHPQGKVAVAGFCMGGAIALRQAIDNDDVFGAGVVWYGRVSGIDAARIRMPICGSYGEKDSSIPPDTVRAFRKVLRAPNDIAIYPTSGHAFFDHTRASYVPVAAEDSWRRAIAFFTKYLKS
ncbi:MAG TPA: dienelactone hydrolase family protein [Candidatus Baltobacteraceae bacterium]|nr:dienelactone hydrolase family protein [Candidatus Baltobacteraceae bacterium]